MDVVLITGGSGLIGNGIKKFISKNKQEATYVFVDSKTVDLRNYEDTEKIFIKYKPVYVIHLAAKVGGLYSNLKFPVEYFNDNILMNTNIIRLCHKYSVKKLISCLSTCIFPDNITYPIDETMIHNGPPHNSNEAYSYAKRMIDIMNRSYSREYNCNFTSIIPTNIYGSFDNFNLENSHVIPGLIHKAYLAKKMSTNFVISGSGNALRQFIFNEDLGEIIIYVMKHYNNIEPIILSVDEKDEVSIKDIVYYIAEFFDIKKENIIFDQSKSDGQFKKTASNKKLRNLIPEYKFTKLKEGIFYTCKWFVENFDTLRK